MPVATPVISSNEELTATLLNGIFDILFSEINNITSGNFAPGVQIPVSNILNALRNDGDTIEGPLIVKGKINGVYIQEIDAALRLYESLLEETKIGYYTIRYVFGADGGDTNYTAYLNGVEQGVGSAIRIEAPEGYNGTDAQVMESCGGQIFSHTPGNSVRFDVDSFSLNETHVLVNPKVSNTGQPLFIDLDVDGNRDGEEYHSPDEPWEAEVLVGIVWKRRGLKVELLT